MSTRGCIEEGEGRRTRGSTSSFLSFPQHSVEYFFLLLSPSPSPPPLLPLLLGRDDIARAMTFRICGGWPVEHLFDLQRYRVPWKTGCGIPISVIPASRPRLEFARNARSEIRFSISAGRISFRVFHRNAMETLPLIEEKDRPTPVARTRIYWKFTFLFFQG